jgi:hypothetical protein
MELLITFLLGLAVVESYAWLPQICRLIVELAIKLLPSEHRERWREEFHESQSALPQSAWKLVEAISLCCCALSMRRDLAVAKTEELLERFDKKMGVLFSGRRAWEAAHRHLVSVIAEGRSRRITLPLQWVSQDVQGPANAATPCAEAFGNFAKTIWEAHNRAMNECAAQADMVLKVMNDAAPLFEKFDRHWKFARRLWPIAQKVPVFGPIAFNCALSVVRRDSETLLSCVEREGLIDEKTLEEARKITLAIQQANQTFSRMSVVAAELGAPRPLTGAEDTAPQ